MLFTEHIFQIIALTTGLIGWRHITPGYLRLIIAILFLTVLNESVIEPYIDDTKITSNDFAYNVFSLFDMAIWLFIFYKIHEGTNTQKAILPLSLLVFAYSLYDILARSTWYKLHIYSMMLYSICLIALAVLYLYRLMQLRYHRFRSNPLFWVAAACIIYHSLLFFNFFTLTLDSYWNWPEASFVYDIIQLLDNIFYYLLLAITFVVCIYYKRELKQEHLQN